MVKITIDQERRLQLMRMHTASHILSRACKNILGYHAWQTGSELSEDISRFDVTHHKSISKAELRKIEDEVNEIIFANKPVEIEEVDRTDAEQRYGFVIYQGGFIPGTRLRIVKIKDYDVQACGGLHVRSTMEIGSFKVLGLTKQQDGVYRFLFTCGKALVRTFGEKMDLIEQVCRVFSTDEKQLVNVSNRFFEEWKEYRKDIEELLKIIVDLSPENRILEIPIKAEMKKLIKLLLSTDKKNIFLVFDNIVAIKSEKVENLPFKGFKKNNILITKRTEELLDEIKNLSNKCLQ